MFLLDVAVGPIVYVGLFLIIGIFVVVVGGIAWFVVKALKKIKAEENQE